MVGRHPGHRVGPSRGRQRAVGRIGDLAELLWGQRSATARRELAPELAFALEQRLADLSVYRGGCPCRHVEARAFLAKLKRLAGDSAPAETCAGA